MKNSWLNIRVPAEIRSMARRHRRKYGFSPFQMYPAYGLFHDALHVLLKAGVDQPEEERVYAEEQKLCGKGTESLDPRVAPVQHLFQNFSSAF